MASVFQCPRSSPSTVFHTRRTERGIALSESAVDPRFHSTSFLICKTIAMALASRAKASSGRCRLQSAPFHVPRDQTQEMQLSDHVLVRVCDGCNRGHLDVVQTERAVFICTCGISHRGRFPQLGGSCELERSCAMPQEMVLGSRHGRPPHRNPLSDQSQSHPPISSAPCQWRRVSAP